MLRVFQALILSREGHHDADCHGCPGRLCGGGAEGVRDDIRPRGACGSPQTASPSTPHHTQMAGGTVAASRRGGLWPVRFLVDGEYGHPAPGLPVMCAVQWPGQSYIPLHDYGASWVV